MKKKPTPPKQSPDYHSTDSVGGLMEILSKYPKGAKIYAPDPDWVGIGGKDPACLEIWQGKKTLANINLTGF